jgi:hypothetical protein
MGTPLLVMQTFFFFVFTSSSTDRQVALNFETDRVSMVFPLPAHSQITMVILWPSSYFVNGAEKSGTDSISRYA